MVCPRCGHIFIKQAVWFYCPVGRGDPTPPGSFAITAKGKEGSRPLPTNNQKVSSYRQSNYFRQVVGDAYMRPVRFTRYIVISGRLQRAAYMPPLRSTRNIRYNIRLRAGHAPPLPRSKTAKSAALAWAALFIGRLCCYPNNQALAALISLISSGTTLYRSPTMP